MPGTHFSQCPLAYLELCLLLSLRLYPALATKDLRKVRLADPPAVRCGLAFHSTRSNWNAGSTIATPSSLALSNLAQTYLSSPPMARTQRKFASARTF